MRTRLLAAAAIVGALTLSLSGAEAAGTPVLDGKKVKTITLSALGVAQDNDAALVTGSVPGHDPARVECAMPRCARMDFIYKPAKGVKGDVAFQVAWNIPGEDMDLYVAEIAKDGSPTELASCGATAGMGEKLFLDSSTFTSGKRYAIIVDFYRTANDAIKASVTMPGTNSVKTTAPAATDPLKVNCGL